MVNWLTRVENIILVEGEEKLRQEVEWTPAGRDERDWPWDGSNVGWNYSSGGGDKEEENPLRGRERPAKGILGKLLRTMFSGTGRSVAPELPVGKLGKLGDGIHGEAWQLSRFRARREVGRGALTSPSMRLPSPTTSREEETCISVGETSLFWETRRNRAKSVFLSRETNFFFLSFPKRNSLLDCRFSIESPLSQFFN